MLHLPVRHSFDASARLCFNRSVFVWWLSGHGAVSVGAGASSPVQPLAGGRCGFFFLSVIILFHKKNYRLIIFWLIFSRPGMPAAHVFAASAAPVVAMHSPLPPHLTQYVPNALFFGVFISSLFIFLHFFAVILRGLCPLLVHTCRRRRSRKCINIIIIIDVYRVLLLRFPTLFVGGGFF